MAEKCKYFLTPEEAVKCVTCHELYDLTLGFSPACILAAYGVEKGRVFTTNEIIKGYKLTSKFFPLNCPNNFSVKI